jgi:aspartate racemase
VLGGRGPAATAEFLRLLAAGAPATTDQQHPRIVLLSDPTVPERTSAIIEGSDEPSASIRDGLLTLASWGADLLVMPCNTAHAFVEDLALPVPLLHIVDATLDAAMTDSPAGGWLTASTGTVASGLYQRRARQRGYRLSVPDPTTQHAVHETSVLVKAGRPLEAATLFEKAVNTLWENEELSVIAACTELPLAYDTAGLPASRIVSSLSALSAACIKEMYGTSTEPVGGRVPVRV